MKKTILAAFLFSNLAYAQYVVIVDKEHSNYTQNNQTTETSEWLFVDTTCINDIETDEHYYGEDFTQKKTCNDNYTRTVKTTTVKENGEVVVDVKEDKKQENNSESTVVVQGTHLETSCALIQSEGFSKGSGNYSVKNNSDTIEVNCNMDLLDGGWTMVTRLNTTDASVRTWENNFWINKSETGDLNNNNDYMSAYTDSENSFSSVLLEFNYNGGVMLAKFDNASNTKNFNESLNQSLSNTNLDFTKTYTNDSVSNDFFGSNLSFQVIGNYASDGFRIWYNKSSKETCNQIGGIGTKGDVDPSQGLSDPYAWWTEAGHTTDMEACQENLFRSYLGTNRISKHPVMEPPYEDLVNNDITLYTTDIIKIYLK